MKYLYLTVVSSVFTLNAMAMQDDNVTESPVSAPPVSLHTVMNPNGVTQDEWKGMFEGERRSIIEQMKYVNEYIDLFNAYFKKLSPKELEEQSASYKEEFNEDLITNGTPLQINSLDSIENVQDIMKTLRRVKNTRLHLLARISGLYNRDIGPIYTLFQNCKTFLESFKPPLTPLQFAHANAAHKKGIKGEGAKILVIENDLVSKHSFFIKNDKIRVGEYFFEDDREEHKGHGAHVTGIVHPMAPGAEIFVSQSINYDKNLISTTPAKIINTSYSQELPLVHLLFEEERESLKSMLTEYKTYKDDPYQIKLTKLIEKTISDTAKCKDCVHYITKFSEKPSSDIPDYEKEIKSYEEDYAGIIMKKASQASCHDAKELLQQNIEMLKGKLRITSFGNSYKVKDWRYDAHPSLVTEDEFLDQTILVMNINRENKLHTSSNRPDDTLKEIIQIIMKENGIDDPRSVDQQLQKIQASSLSALGTNVWSAGSSDRYEWYTGTSMAAPMVTGAAALIEGKYPDFSDKEIRECLLNSASREFVIGTGQDERHVIDLPQDQIDLLNEKNLGLRKCIAFNPFQYGKGILNAEAALKYAEFKAANRSASIDELVNRLSQWKRGQE